MLSAPQEVLRARAAQTSCSPGAGVVAPAFSAGWAPAAWHHNKTGAYAAFAGLRGQKGQLECSWLIAMFEGCLQSLALHYHGAIP